MGKNHRRATTVLAVMGAALGLAGCGGDDAPQLTKSEFVERGSAICAETTRQVDEAATTAFSEPGVIPPAEEITQFAGETVAPQISEELDELEELRPPEDDVERVDDIIQAGRDGVDDVREDPTILLSSSDDGLARYRELASAYGLEGCGGISPETRNKIAGIGG